MMSSPSIKTPKSELARRVASFQQSLRARAVDGVLILQKTDQYYFSGTIQEGVLYIPSDGEPVLMVRKSFERAREESELRNVIPLRSSRDIPQILRDHNIAMPRTIGVEADVLPAILYFQYQAIFSSADLVDVSTEIRAVRAVKSDYEIDIIREAARRADQMLDAAREYIAEGLTEIELAGMIEANARKLGHQGITRMRRWGNELFFGHLMAGSSAALPSYLASPNGGPGTSPAVAQGPGMGRVERHQPIIIDYVFAWNGYMADITRIFCLGEPEDDFHEAQDAMIAVMAAVQEAARPGVSAGEVYDLAVKTARKRRYGSYFMGPEDSRVMFVGHGIGIELDEFPFIAKGQTMLLEAGMVIAVEPKLIFPGRGMVGVENTHLLTEEGLEPLTRLEEKIIVV